MWGTGYYLGGVPKDHGWNGGEVKIVLGIEKTSCKSDKLAGLGKQYEKWWRRAWNKKIEGEGECVITELNRPNKSNHMLQIGVAPLVAIGYQTESVHPISFAFWNQQK